MIRLGSSFLRALGYSVMPKAIAIAFLPMILLTVSVMVLGHFFWEPAQSGIREWMSTVPWLHDFLQWLQTSGWGAVSAVMVPLLVIALSTPLLIVFSLLAVSVFASSHLVRWVRLRRFPHLTDASNRQWWRDGLQGLGLSVLALALLSLTLPLWLIPPLGIVCPMFILGWLTYRIMLLDVLSECASEVEREQLLERHRWQWLAMGVISGLMGTLPSLVWSSFIWFATLFIVLAPLAMWVYTWVFVLTTLWFAHHALQSLDALRATTPTPQPLDTLSP